MAKSNDGSGEQQVQLRWVESEEDLPAVYANHLYISHAGPEFVLIFGRAEVPVGTGTPGVDPPEFVPIRPVAKLIVAPGAMTGVVEAISRNVSRAQEASTGDDDDDAAD